MTYVYLASFLVAYSRNQVWLGEIKQIYWKNFRQLTNLETCWQIRLGAQEGSKRGLVTRTQAQPHAPPAAVSSPPSPQSPSPLHPATSGPLEHPTVVSAMALSHCASGHYLAQAQTPREKVPHMGLRRPILCARQSFSELWAELHHFPFSSNLYGEVPNLSTSKWDLIWKQGHCGCIQLKLGQTTINGPLIIISSFIIPVTLALL